MVLAVINHIHSTSAAHDINRSIDPRATFFSPPTNAHNSQAFVAEERTLAQGGEMTGGKRKFRVLRIDPSSPGSSPRHKGGGEETTGALPTPRAVSFGVVRSIFKSARSIHAVGPQQSINFDRRHSLACSSVALDCRKSSVHSPVRAMHCDPPAAAHRWLRGSFIYPFAPSNICPSQKFRRGI